MASLNNPLQWIEEGEDDDDDLVMLSASSPEVSGSDRFSDQSDESRPQSPEIGVRGSHENQGTNQRKSDAETVENEKKRRRGEVRGLTPTPSPDSKRRTRSAEIQTSPSLMAPLLAEASSTKHDLMTSSQATDESCCCTICFDTWTTSGAHRLASLKCGHLFGRSCIDRWLEGQGPKPRCPQCNSSAKKSDVRNLYAKGLKALDTNEQEKALRDYAKERARRKKAEVQASSSRTKLNLALAECEKLKKQLMDCNRVNQQLRSSKRINDIAAHNKSTLIKTRKEPFNYVKSVEISSAGGCKVLAASDMLGMITVSQPSSNPLFPGWGVKKISSTDLKLSDFVLIHSKQIKDVSFHPNDALILTSSWDKTAKLTDLINNKPVSSYTVEVEAWSNCWDKRRPYAFYVGLRNGNIVEFDSRVTNNSVRQLEGVGSSPVVSMQFAHFDPMSEPEMTGIVASNLSSASFVELNENSYQTHLMPIEGAFMSTHFDPKSGLVLLTCRPSIKHHKVTHTLVEMSLSESQSAASLSPRVVQTFEGGSRAMQLTRSKLYPHPDDEESVLVCSGDEESGSTLIWSSSRGSSSCFQKLRNSSPPILDLALVDSNNGLIMTTLSEKNLNLYKWVL